MASPLPRQVHYFRCCSRLEGANIEHGGMAAIPEDNRLHVVIVVAIKAIAPCIPEHPYPTLRWLWPRTFGYILR